MADQVLDAKGLNCPLPILKAKKALKSMEGGKILEVQSTDPGLWLILLLFAVPPVMNW